MKHREITTAAPVEIDGQGRALTESAQGGAVARTRPHDRAAARQGPSILRRVAGWAPFFAVVIVPTAMAVGYFGFYAADRYVAEAQFVVRNAERSVATGLGAILQSTGLSTAQDDAYIVQSYMLSRDALKGLNERIDYTALMGDETADFLARWPNWWDGDTFEGLFDYYQRRVAVTRDLTTGVLTLTVEAFVPEHARRVADALLEQGETLINGLNARALDDALSLARTEVALAETRIMDNQAAMERYRRAEGLLSPLADTEMQMTLVTELSTELAGLRAEARRLEQTAPNSPQLPAARSRVEALAEQVALEKARLVGDGGNDLADAFADFEALMLERKFAEEALLAARASLEQARTDAIRQQSYLATLVRPMAPDEARQPRRAIMILTVASGAFLLYAVGWLLWVNAREHDS